MSHRENRRTSQRKRPSKLKNERNNNTKKRGRPRKHDPTLSNYQKHKKYYQKYNRLYQKFYRLKIILSAKTKKKKEETIPILTER